MFKLLSNFDSDCLFFNLDKLLTVIDTNLLGVEITLIYLITGLYSVPENFIKIFVLLKLTEIPGILKRMLLGD